jgi:putative ABC transport system permease protein
MPAWRERWRALRAAARRTTRLAPAIALDAALQLAAHRRQNLLTFVGLAWGGAAVVLLVSVGSGFTRFLDLGAAKSGDRWLLVRGIMTTADSGGAREGRPVVFEDEDLAQLSADVPEASALAGEVTVADAFVETPREGRPNAVSAATHELGRIQNHAVAEGRFFDERDDREHRRVAVLGGSLAEIFFGSEPPLGRTIRISGIPFEVIGVMRRKGSQLVRGGQYDFHDNMVFLPLGSGRDVIGKRDQLDQIYVNPQRIDEIPLIERKIHAVLERRQHIDPADEEAIHIESVHHVLAPTRIVGLALQILLGGVGTVTLVLGGAGVANLMLAVVNERRRELAMRRACGARRSDVVLQILLESVVVIVAGGGVGVAFGSLVVLGIQALPLPADLPEPRLSASVLATTLGVLIGVGLSSGVLPAGAASRVDPALALRVV